MANTFAETWNSLAKQVKSWRLGRIHASNLALAAEQPASEIGHIERRLWKHLNDYSDIQLMLAAGTPLDRLPQARKVCEDARNLAFEISLIPNFQDAVPLATVQRVLVEHWRAHWTTNGISEGEYRISIKVAILFLRQHMAFSDCAEAAAIFTVSGLR